MKFIMFTLISTCSGLLSARAIRRFMNFEIEQFSVEYQVCGFLGAIACVFSGMFAIAELMRYIINLFIL